MKSCFRSILHRESFSVLSVYGPIRVVSRTVNLEILKMRTDRRELREFFGGDKTYRVPLYQRHYRWHEKYWENLWTDIMIKSKQRCTDGGSEGTHFVGATIIQPDSEGNLEIIDGQQRLITFQLILCAVRDVCSTFDGDPRNMKCKVNSYLHNRLTYSSVPGETL